MVGWINVMKDSKMGKRLLQLTRRECDVTIIDPPNELPIELYNVTLKCSGNREDDIILNPFNKRVYGLNLFDQYSHEG